MQETNTFQVPQSMIGKLLVASTTVQDPILSRSVSLVVHQDTANVYAVLLNRPMTPPQGMVKLVDSSGNSLAVDNPATTASSDLAHSGDQLTGPSDPNGSDLEKSALARKTAADASKSLGTIHFGGPLSGPVVAVHNRSELAESQAGQGVYVAAQRDHLEALVKQRPEACRLIVGHLGWSLEQLQNERAAGFWHVIDATEDDVFTGDQELWHTVIRRATGASLANWVGLPTAPACVEWN